MSADGSKRLIIASRLVEDPHRDPGACTRGRPGMSSGLRGFGRSAPFRAACVRARTCVPAAHICSPSRAARVPSCGGAGNRFDASEGDFHTLGEPRLCSTSVRGRQRILSRLSVQAVFVGYLCRLSMQILYILGKIRPIF